jgi:hypothetical protein
VSLELSDEKSHRRPSPYHPQSPGFTPPGARPGLAVAETLYGPAGHRTGLSPARVTVCRRAGSAPPGSGHARLRAPAPSGADEHQHQHQRRDSHEAHPPRHGDRRSCHRRGGTGAATAITAWGSGTQAPAAATPPSGSSSYSYYRSMMGRLYSASGSSGMMSGTSSRGWMMGGRGYGWMMGGLDAPAWMRRQRPAGRPT